jgi:hypothetical protein
MRVLLGLGWCAVAELEKSRSVERFLCAPAKSSKTPHPELFRLQIEAKQAATSYYPPEILFWFSRAGAGVAPGRLPSLAFLIRKVEPLRGWPVDLRAITTRPTGRRRSSE